MTRIGVLCNDRLALPALAALLQAGRVVAVGMADIATDIRPVVEQLCRNARVPCTFFAKKGLEAGLLEWLHIHSPAVVLVKTFPWKIPAAVLAIPPMGFINFHYAPLPGWRGPNPLFWIIRQQVPQGGISVHQMDGSFDTGPLIMQAPIPISPDISFGMLNTQLAFAGQHLTQHLLPLLDSGQVSSFAQTGPSNWYRKPQASDLVIDWHTMTASSIKALVKACNPWNKGAVTSWNGWSFGITEASIHPAEAVNEAIPGTIVEISEEKGLLVTCVDNLLLKAEIVYCEEGFFMGHQLALFGLQKLTRLGVLPVARTTVDAGQEPAIA
ncbi:methionyl-tRNA formyltransferase [Paraflavitalea pollutisoli]|uniref:methionyl-tRNA formyltransferase n=1 Tax=Paraflavitalea pollutisoli TaxID=3034143 RepID=UPI0023EB5953|nr:formyltransferase family protein [Paraflavitalea sp. H1-2-19X]